MYISVREIQDAPRVLAGHVRDRDVTVSIMVGRARHPMDPGRPFFTVLTARADGGFKLATVDSTAPTLAEAAGLAAREAAAVLPSRPDTVDVVVR